MKKTLSFHTNRFDVCLKRFVALDEVAKYFLQRDRQFFWAEKKLGTLHANRRTARETLVHNIEQRMRKDIEDTLARVDSNLCGWHPNYDDAKDDLNNLLRRINDRDRAQWLPASARILKPLEWGE